MFEEGGRVDASVIAKDEESRRRQETSRKRCWMDFVLFMSRSVSTGRSRQYYSSKSNEDASVSKEPELDAASMERLEKERAIRAVADQRRRCALHDNVRSVCVS